MYGIMTEAKVSCEYYTQNIVPCSGTTKLQKYNYRQASYSGY